MMMSSLVAAATVTAVMTVVRCPRGNWLYTRAGRWIVNVRPLPDRHTHDGRGDLVRCTCRMCRGRVYSVVAYGGRG